MSNHQLRTICVTTSIVLATAQLAHAGLIVALVANPPGSDVFPDGVYVPGERVSVDVFIRQNQPSNDHLIRFLQFDFSKSTVSNISMPVVDEVAGVPFWDFGSAGCLVGCNGIYAPDSDLDGNPADIISIDWQFGGPRSDIQMILPGDGSPIRVGVFEFAAPNVIGGAFILDLLDVGDSDYGAELRFGFGSDDPPTTWRADAGDITGGQYLFFVDLPEPSTLILLGVGAFALAGRRKSR